MTKIPADANVECTDGACYELTTIAVNSPFGNR